MNNSKKRSESGPKLRFRSEHKLLLNCKQADVNQILPLKYRWAWEHYLNGCANHWMPTEVPMDRDVALWKSTDPSFCLSEGERLVIMRNLGFFATAESLVANNIALGIFKHVTNAEVRQYLLRQAFEEAIHTHSFLYMVSSLGLDEGEIFNMYNEVDSIQEKDEFEIAITEQLLDPNFNTETPEGMQLFLKNLICYYVILEGIFFYSGFAMILTMYQQNKMVGIGEMFRYILRDESIHLNFGIDLINGIKEENPEIWTPEFKKEMIDLIDHAVGLEIRYAKDCLPDGVLGLNAAMFDQYVKYISDRRLERIGLPKQYNAVTPFPQLSELMDLPKEENFFERTVQEYQSASTLTF